MDQQKKRIVILGAGFAGIYTYKRLHYHFHNDPSVELVLVNETNYFLFTPLLHEVATGSISPENVIEPIRKVLNCCLSNLYVGKVEKISSKKQIVHTSVGDISYDYLVLALGAQTVFYNIPGAEERSYTLKNLEDALTLKNRFITVFENATKETNEKKRKRMLNFVVVGGGPTGVELVAEIAELFYSTFKKYYTRNHIFEDIQIQLVQAGSELLPMFSEPVRKKSLKVLEHKGVKVHLNTSVTKIDAKGVHLSSGELMEADTIVWVAGVGATHVPFDVAVEQGKSSRIIVEPTFQVTDQENIFALGDMAQYEQADTPLPMLAQVAVREADTVADNIMALIKGGNPAAFRYKSKGSLVSLGQWMAAGEVSKFHFSGHVAWWLWRTVYLSKLISWQKKFKVAVDWTVNLFSPRDISQF